MKKPLIIFVLGALLMGLSCDTEEPESIFNPNATADPDPVITGITPPDTAYGGADERYTVTIVGQDFGDNGNEVLVNFGSELAEIISHSATEMIVSPPANFSDSLRVKATKFGSNACWEFGLYKKDETTFRPYKLLNPVSKIAGFDAYTLPQSVCVDSEGNVFVTHEKIIERVSLDGTITTIGELKGKLTTRLHVGSDGALYYTFINNIMKVDTTTFTHAYDKLNTAALDMDFDRNDNLYAIDENSIYSVDKTTMEPTEIITYDDEYPDTALACMRIFDDDLYMTGSVTDSNNVIKRYIWKMALDINAGTVTGDLMEVYDWSMTVYSDVNVSSITFDVNGQLLVGTKNYSILVIYPIGSDYATGEIKKMYKDIIGDEYIHRIYWGPDNYLYISTYNLSDTENAKLLKANMFGTGAPYYGRN